MDNVRLRIQVDFGVGDVIVRGPRMIEYPVFLGGDTIALLAYPVETSIAEKTPSGGRARRRQQPYEGLLRCLDLCESSRF